MISCPECGSTDIRITGTTEAANEEDVQDIYTCSECGNWYVEADIIDEDDDD